MFKILLFLGLSFLFTGMVSADLASDLVSQAWNTNSGPSPRDFAFLAVLAPAALADSINPCAFAILFLLLTSILSKTKSMKKAVFSGMMYVLSIFISYLAMWIGLYNAMASTENTFMLKVVVWVLGVTVWLLNLKDYLWYGRWGFAFGVPKAWKPYMHGLVWKITSPAWAFFVWLIVSLLLLPCTSGPYITLLWVLWAEYGSLTGMVYFHLITYNLIFVTPMIVIIALIALGKQKVENLQKARQQNIRLIHLVIWLLMLGLWLYVLGDAFNIFSNF